MNPIHDIIESIYNDKRVNEFIAKLKPTYLQADLKSHCIYEIYRLSNKYPGKIETLFQNDQMFAWFTGMAKMQLFSERSTFYRLYVRGFEDDVHLTHISYNDNEYEFDWAIVDAEKEETADWAYTQLDRYKAEQQQIKPLAPAPVQLELFN